MTITIKELMHRAVNEDDHRAAGKVAEYLRFNVGMDYDTILGFINQRYRITRARWDELLYRADEDN